MAMEPKPAGRFWSRPLRRWKWLVGGVTGVFLVYTLAGFFLVPRIIDSQIRTRARDSLHREARTADVKFNPFTFATTIRGFTLLDRDGTDLLTFDRLFVDMEPTGLFRRAFLFREISIDRPVVTARIMPDGKPSIADLMESPPTNPGAAPSQPPRVIVNHLTVSGGVVNFKDAARQPAYETRFDPLNLDVTNLMTIPQESGAHNITVGVGNGAKLRWTGQQIMEPLSFAGRLDVSGLDLHWLWEYVGNGQPMDVTEGRADLELPYTLRRGDDQQLQLTLDKATATVRALTVRPRESDEDWLTIPELQVQNVKAAWPASHVDVESVRIVNPQVLSRVEEDGTLNWAHALTSGTSSADPRAVTSPSTSSPSWTARLGSLEIQDGDVVFEDKSAAPEVRLELAGIEARATDVSSDLASPIPINVMARLKEHGAIELNGTVAPSPLDAKVTFATRGIELMPLRRYIRALPGAQIASGTAALQGEVMASGEQPKIRVAANGTVDGVELQDLGNERLIAWRRMAIDGLTVEHPADRMRVSKITLEEPFARIHIDRSGNLNLTRLTVDPSAPAQSGAVTEKGADRAVEIGMVEIRDATADYSDDSLPLPFRTAIHSAKGTIRDISSFGAAPATLGIEGRVDETGYVKADGTLRVANPMAASDVRVVFRDIQMPNLTPYFADFAGYAIRRGVLDLDVAYDIKERRLIGTHKVVARDLVLGDKVDGTKGAPFPVKLAIALLKDKEGRINLDVPIEGTVDSPEFAYRKVFWSAMGTMAGNVAKAPFKAIGHLFGHGGDKDEKDDEDLDLVEFDAGRSDLIPEEQAMLAQLTEQIGARPELTIQVEGRYDPETDAPVLKRTKFEKLIDERRQQAAAAAEAGGRSTLELVLEQLFTEQFSAEALQAERKKFTALPRAASVTAPAALPSDARLDAEGFYESLRSQLFEAQSVGEADLTALATARSMSIVAALTEGGEVDETRIKVMDPTKAKRQKKGSTRVASELAVSADVGDESAKSSER
jgi:Domain of Unknown Function (DUF748)